MGLVENELELLGWEKCINYDWEKEVGKKKKKRLFVMTSVCVYVCIHLKWDAF